MANVVHFVADTAKRGCVLSLNWRRVVHVLVQSVMLGGE